MSLQENGGFWKQTKRRSSSSMPNQHRVPIWVNVTDPFWLQRMNMPESCRWIFFCYCVDNGKEVCYTTCSKDDKRCDWVQIGTISYFVVLKKRHGNQFHRHSGDIQGTNDDFCKLAVLFPFPIFEARCQAPFPPFFRRIGKMWFSRHLNWEHGELENASGSVCIQRS